MREKTSKRPRRVGEASAAVPAGALSPSSKRYTPEQRRLAVEAFERSGQTQEAFSRNYGVTANTLYSWRRAYAARGAQGLEHVGPGVPGRRGRRPMPAQKREAIEATKRRFPTFGIRKVSQFLARFVGIQASPGTVRTTLKAAGLATPPARARRRPGPPREFQRAHPGELWQSDITYLHVPWNRTHLYLIAFLDDCSRYVVSFGLHLQQRQGIAIEALLLGISRFGRPKEVLTDQGRQYHAWRGKSAFDKVLDREGIRHVLARAHHPETVGKCERFWDTIKTELWDRIHPKDLEEARARLAHYVAHYNHFRPHQALDGLTPADRFFGAEKAVREAIERAMERNELLLALNEPVRKPVFLVGQIGEQSVSLHGEKGRVVLQTEDGLRREFSMDELGIPKEVQDGGAKEGRERRVGSAATPAPEPARPQADEGERPAELSAAGASPLAAGERGGAAASASGDGDDPGDVAGQDHARGGGRATVDAAAALLAALPAGGGRDGGGVPEAAPGAPGEARDGDGPGGGPPRPAPAGRRVGEGPGGCAQPDLDPAGTAGAPGRAGGDVGEGPWPDRAARRRDGP
jgi:transposase InsO family protein/transposase-like protein